MSENQQSQLHIPEGINFECTACGNCCFEWPVPITASDFARISKYAETRGSDSRQLFRVLSVEDEKLKVFSHSLEKRADGLCEFLTEDMRCQLHIDYGADAKPSMCRLFPYTFTQTPSGTYASVSFAASGVLFNRGRALIDQRPLLAGQLDLFKELFPDLALDWSTIQLVDGQGLKWHDYLALESPLLEKLRDIETDNPVEKTLFDQSERFRRRVGARLDNVAGLTTNPKVIDQVLVKHLLQTYFPDDVFQAGVCQVDAQSVAREFLLEPRRVSFRHRGEEFAFQDVLKKRLGRLSSESADLLRRFIYLRVFSKLYFGPGFNYFSVIAGLHHLCVLVCLLRIRLKLETLARGLEKLSDEDCLLVLAEDTRKLERRLTVASFEQEAIAMLEILLLSPKRIERLISLAG